MEQEIIDPGIMQDKILYVQFSPDVSVVETVHGVFVPSHAYLILGLFLPPSALQENISQSNSREPGEKAQLAKCLPPKHSI